MIASVDGRLYTSRWTPGPEGADITTVYENRRFAVQRRGLDGGPHDDG